MKKTNTIKVPTYEEYKEYVKERIDYFVSMLPDTGDEILNSRLKREVIDYVTKGISMCSNYEFDYRKEWLEDYVSIEEQEKFCEESDIDFDDYIFDLMLEYDQKLTKEEF